MDKNTITGVALISLVLIAFTIFSKPKPTSEIQSPQKEISIQERQSVEKQEATETKELVVDGFNTNSKEANFYTLENDKVSVQFSTLGGVPIQAQLKEYQTAKDLPLLLFTKEDASFNIPLRTVSGKIVDTKKLIFEPIQKDSQTLIMRLRVDESAFLDFIYTLSKDNYLLNFKIEGEKLEKLFPNNMRYLDLELFQKLRCQEQSWQNENRYSSLYYKFKGGDVESLSENDTEDLNERLDWFAFKDKFFASVLIAGKNNSFENTRMEQKTLKKDGDYTKECKVTTSFLFDNSEGTKAEFSFFFGPLQHHLLESYDQSNIEEEKLHLEHLVYVGGSVFRWINVGLIIPVVDFLSNYINNWGIIILLLTLIIKTALSPLTFKSYMSQAKMRVLKPQVNAINEKYPGKDQQSMMKRSQETMALYKSAGASPMSGCLPMLLQMPFLISLYMFFPTAIALRGESFLWAQDLSSYDAVISWDFTIPIISSVLGNHISLFCLLWAVTNIMYSKYTMGQNGVGDNQQAKMMQWMPYIMSIMFFVMFNENASGLCYYYFVSTLITVLQFIASRFMINEEKLLIQLEENKKKPRKKSGFMARLEEAQRMQQQMQQSKKKNR